MRSFVLIIALLLAGCSTTNQLDVGEAKPVQLPPLPPELSQKAQALPPLTSNDLEALVKDSIETDRAYNDLAFRFNTVISIYECVRQAANTTSDADIEKCLSKP